MTIGKKVKHLLYNEEFFKSNRKATLTQGMALKIIRKKNELSQNELADLTGLTQSTISSIENNRISIGIERAKTLAKALKVHPALLAFPDWQEVA